MADFRHASQAARHRTAHLDPAEPSTSRETENPPERRAIRRDCSARHAVRAVQVSALLRSGAPASPGRGPGCGKGCQQRRELHNPNDDSGCLALVRCQCIGGTCTRPGLILSFGRPRRATCRMPRALTTQGENLRANSSRSSRACSSASRDIHRSLASCVASAGTAKRGIATWSINGASLSRRTRPLSSDSEGEHLRPLLAASRLLNFHLRMLDCASTIRPMTKPAATSPA